MKSKLILSSVLALSASGAMAASVSSSKGYALSDDGTSLVLFNDLSMAGSNSRTVSLSGGKLDAIAYRPVTGELYGYSAGDGTSGDKVFVVDTSSGNLTDVSATFDSGAAAAAGSKVGFDFNNQIDAARVVTTGGDNLVFFPDTFPSANAGTVKRFTDPFYGTGDVNEGTSPEIFANAYTNAVNGATAGSTFQYAIDAVTDSLVSLANNAGTLATIGKITVDGKAVDISAMGGFDIVSESEGDNLAIALLSIGATGSEMSGLYTIDLSSGAASRFADLGNGSYSGFAAQLAPVPLPAPAMLLLFGVGALGVAARRKKAA